MVPKPALNTRSPTILPRIVGDRVFNAGFEYSITNNSSKNLNKIRIFYSGTISETVSGYTTINSSIPKGTTKTFITRVGAYDYLEGVTLKVTSAS